MKMKIYTGNFANVKKYRIENLEPISIALSARYFNGTSYGVLNPDRETMSFDNQKYTKYFNAKLAKLDAKRVVEDLQSMSRGKDVVLCCHESEGVFCHRMLVAEWLTKELGIEVKELGKMKKVEPVKRVSGIQISMF